MQLCKTEWSSLGQVCNLVILNRIYVSGYVSKTNSFEQGQKLFKNKLGWITSRQILKTWKMIDVDDNPLARITINDNIDTEKTQFQMLNKNRNHSCNNVIL